MDDAKALIAASGLRIIACDDLEEAAEMVRALIFLSYNHGYLRIFLHKGTKVLKIVFVFCSVTGHELLESFLFFLSSGCPSFQYC